MNRRRTIAVHELRTQLTSAPFAALLLLLVAATSTLNPVAFIPGGADTDAPVRAIANSVYALAPTFAMSGFFVYPFFAALMAGLSVLRDEEASVSELLHSTPLTKTEYYWSKFAGVMGALLVAMSTHVVVVMIFREVGVGGIARGPFEPSAYLVAAGLFVIPGVLWMAGLAFVVGARTRAPITVYVLPVALFVLEFALLWNWHPRTIDPILDAALMIADPTGLRWLTHSLFTIDRGIVWYNTAALAVDSTLIVGRLFTLLLPVSAVAFLAHRAKRAGTSSLAVRRVRKLPSEPVASTTRSFGNLASLPMHRRLPSTLRATVTVLLAELRSLVRQPSGYLFAVFLFAAVAEVGGAEADVYGSTAVLTAGGIAINALPVVTILTCLFLLFVIVEGLHRDRATGFEAIALSSPVPTTSFMIGRVLAAIVLISVFTFVCVLSGGVLLLAQSGPTGTLWPLLLIFGAVLGPTYLLWTAFVTAVMSLVQSRTAALAIGFVALLLTGAQFIRGSMTWVTNWPLWGSLRWTEFAVFPLDGEALVLNRLLALGLALALFGAARMLFVRTERDPAAARARRTPAAVGRLVLRASPLALLPVFTSAFLAVRVHNAYDGLHTERAAVAYETTHQQQWAPVMPAVIQHVDVSVALDPANRRLSVDGIYRMINRTSTPIASLAFTVPVSFGQVSWQVDGHVATPGVDNGLHLLALASPLAPGDTVRVGFRYDAHINDGLSRNGGSVESFVLSSSVLLSTHRGDFLPVPGYRPTGAATVRAVDNSGTADDTLGDVEYFNRGWKFTATMRVRAPRALTVNAIGQQTTSITTGDEIHSTWETTEAVSALALVGGEFAVRADKGVAVYHHPSHTQSLDVIVNTLSAARKHYSKWFAPYPWNELRLSEYADLAAQATSYPTNIAFSEGMGFLTTDGDHGGLAFAVTAHEAAHQWWGHLLTADTGPGTGLLVEGMADYATLLLYEAERGATARKAYAALLERQYLDQRNGASERTLLETREATGADEAVLQKKGAWAMWMLHNHLGAEQMFSGLRKFIADYRAPGRFATPEALLRTLRSHANDTAQFDDNVSQWFRSTELPEFRLHNAQCAPVAREWICDATLRNHGQGAATVDAAAMKGDSIVLGRTTRTHINAGGSLAVRWRLPTRPDRLIVDPDVIVLQVGRERAVATPLIRSARGRQ